MLYITIYIYIYYIHTRNMSIFTNRSLVVRCINRTSEAECFVQDGGAQSRGRRLSKPRRLAIGQLSPWGVGGRRHRHLLSAEPAEKDFISKSMTTCYLFKI